ncbi:MAG TPA: hypothetical protein VFA70_15880 [Dehalococcoidia bacterium]|nr:hypothetical protein [Dehalococcoidia bacterium]
MLAAAVAALVTGGISPRRAYACEGGPGYDPVADSDVVVVGQVAWWESLAPTPAVSAGSTGPFVPIRVTLQIARALKGSAPATLTFVDDASRLVTPTESGAWAGASGACGSFDADPTGKQVIIGLRQETDGLYHADRLRTFYIGDGPQGGDYLAFQAALDRAANVAIPHLSPGGAGPAARVRLTPEAGPGGTTAMLVGVGFLPGDLISLEILGNLETSRIATATVAADGGFRVPVIIPQGQLPPALTVLAVSLSTPIGIDARAQAPRATFTVTTSGPCPLEQDACDFAATLNRAWLGGADAAFLAQLAPQTYTCSGPAAQGLGGPYPLCDGSIAGEQRSGYPLENLGSEGVVLSAAQYRDFLQRVRSQAAPTLNDAAGDGALRLVTLGCAGQASDAAACPEHFTVVFSALKRAPAPLGQIRYAYLFTVQRLSSQEFRVTDTAVGATPMLVPIETVRGGTTDAGLLNLTSRGAMTFYPWVPVRQMPAAGVGPAASTGKQLPILLALAGLALGVAGFRLARGVQSNARWH